LPRKHPVRARRLAFAELLDQDFVGLESDTVISQLLLAQARREDKPLRLRVQVKSFDVVAKLIEAGLGIGVLPEAAARAFAGPHGPAPGRAHRRVGEPADVRGRAPAGNPPRARAAPRPAPHPGPALELTARPRQALRKRRRPACPKYQFRFAALQWFHRVEPMNFRHCRQEIA
jgi:DNA-binding transcriptional LysR family regulator